jgi:ribulose-5-phosphate 4-epimerase/fuculose-1-phosphate aldolase
MIDLEQELEKIIKDTAEVARILWEMGWAESSAGNISVNVTEHIPEGLSDAQLDELERLFWTKK